MSRNPPIPSKNALRVLRRLAFSSTTVLSAVGGVCGLATLNHEARRRVKLAERVVATKTTLRSVSNGRGQTHVARMCEAAERGEDFTLDENKTHKRRRVRHQSTLAFDQWNGNDRDILALQHSLQSLSHRPRSRSSELQHSSSEKPSIGMPEGEHRTSNHHIIQSRISNQPPLEYRQPFPEPHNRLGSYSKPPSTTARRLPETRPRQGQKNSPSAERILAASQVPLKRDAYGVYARQTRQYATKTPRLEASAIAVRSLQDPAVEEYDEAEGSLYLESMHHSGSSHVPVAEEYDEAEGSPYLEFMHHPGTAHSVSNNDAQKSADRTQPDRQRHSTRQSGKSGTEARSGMMSGDSAHNTTVSHASSYASAQGTGVSLLPDDANAFVQWPGIPRTDEALDNDLVDMADSEDITASQESVGSGHETERKDYFTALHDALASSRSKFGLAHEIGHLQASGYQEVGSHVNRKHSFAETSAFSSGAVSAAIETDGLVTTRSSIPKILDHATIQVRMLENRTGSPTGIDIAQANEKIDSLLAQTDLEALRVSFYGLKDETCKPAVLTAMTRCLDLNTPSSLIDAEILYYAFNGKSIVTANDKPCQRLISLLLKDEKSYARAASILFPASAARTDHYQPSVQIPYKAASFYLAWFCRQEPDPTTWIEEVWKIISLAQQRGILLHDRLIRFVLKALIVAKQPGLAQKLVSEVRTRTKMEITFLSYGILIRKQAADGEWPSVHRMLERLHSDGLSRTRPIGFSMLFNDVLQEYLRQKPLNQAYDYLIDATGTLGLVPTSTVSTTIIIASLRQERYDLIQDWVEFMRQLFPAVDLGSGSAFSAWRVAQLWKERSSSCEEIECGCQAIAYGALRDPFSPAFRGVALAAVETDLRGRMSIANDLWLYPSQVDLEHSFAKMNLKDMIKFVEEYSAKHPSSNDLPLRQREHYKDLLRQLTAVTRLNALFGGDVPRQKLHVTRPASGHHFKPFIPATEEQDPAEAALEIRVNSSKFPDRSELWSMLSSVYVGRQRRGQKAVHGVLEYLIPRMTRAERMADALTMLESMYDSPYVQGPQGTPFTEAIFSIWLYIALELKNGNALSKTLWALVDSGIDVETDMLLLVRIACNSKSGNKHLPDVERMEVTEECRYLMSKLQQRRWIRTGRKKKEEIPKFAEFQTWEERMRSERVNAFWEGE